MQVARALSKRRAPHHIWCAPDVLRSSGVSLKDELMITYSVEICATGDLVSANPICNLRGTNTKMDRAFDSLIRWVYSLKLQLSTADLLAEQSPDPSLRAGPISIIVMMNRTWVRVGFDVK